MGNSVPPALQADDILSLDPSSAHSKFVECMRDKGFAILTLNPKMKNAVDNYFKDAEDFFSLPLEEKKKFNSLDELQRQINKNYVHVSGSKEFMKLQKNEDTNIYPTNPHTFKKSFDSVFEHLETLSKRCFTLIAKYTSAETKHSPFINDDVYKIIMKKMEERSSVSTIHYFPVKKSDSSTEINNEPSKTHTDTGILTLIMCASVPGLQVQDRSKDENTFIEVEKLVKPREHIFCIIGRKTELMSNVKPSVFTPTTHRVLLPFGVERYSLLFFMDVPI
eukprot:TRINITY_DN10446_c0_g1_i2.p1 TRINITY_DN10446_c0_g1~~TRINITY_DN10446_c0_g1_i2.p1  ORF type:complete len:301 (-),score=63.63 TRINITY_DN10446_c0_g1_i2:17-850(-)